MDTEEAIRRISDLLIEVESDRLYIIELEDENERLREQVKDDKEENK